MDWTEAALVRFAERCKTDLAKSLAPYQFVLDGEEFVLPFYCSLALRAGERYVRASLSFDPRDAPYVCEVALGEGSNEMPERDWNAVGLWRLLPANRRPPVEIRSVEQTDTAISEFIANLRDHAMDFLTADLVRFRKLRAEQNADRAPYMIYAPDHNGRYFATPEPESVRLKERYSKPD